MDMAKYDGYFHDGYIYDIIHEEKNICFFLESCVIDPKEIPRNITLSKSNTLKGILKVYNIKKYMLNNKEDHNHFKMQYDYAEILDLEINENNKLFLLLEWKNRPPKSRINILSKLEIEAEKIDWEPIPDLKFK